MTAVGKALEAHDFDRVEVLLAHGGYTFEDYLAWAGIPQDAVMLRAPQSAPRDLTTVTLVLPVGTDPVGDRGRIHVLAQKYLPESQVETVWRGPDGRWRAKASLDPISARPSAETIKLAPGVKPTDADRVQATLEKPGRHLVAWSPFTGEAVTAVLDPHTVGVRARIAAALGCRPWEVDVAESWVADDDGPRLDTVTIERAPAMSTAEKRATFWRETILACIPGGSAGWTVEDVPQAQRVVLRHGRPPVLPARVHLVPTADVAGMLPEQVDSGAWSVLPLGVGPDGEPTAVDLRLGPHTVMVGPTGSGKSVGLAALVSQALCRGHDVVLVDVVKGGVDFIALQRFTSGWASTLPEAEKLIQAVYTEVGRRRALCVQYAAPSWRDLPPEVQVAEGIRPTLVVVDEYVSSVLPRTVSKALPPRHPLRAEAEEANAQKAVLAELVGRIAREARFVGVFLALAAQRPDAAYLSGELRSNLTSAVQLTKPGSPPAREALGMVLSADQVPAALATLAALDDGTSVGLGLIGAEGGGVRGMRVAYTPPRQIGAYLDSIGVPDGRPIRTSGPSRPALSETKSVESEGIWGDE